MDITSIDLNLLRVFNALMEERNATRAGLRLGLSQPSVSHAITKLRAATGDPLFVRVATGMEPTAYAHRMALLVREGLALFAAAVAQEPEFIPASSNRTFELLMSDIGEIAYIPRLMKELQECAPGVDIRVVQLPRDAYEAAMTSGAIDLAIGYLPMLESGFHQRRLFEDAFMCIARNGHPRIKGRLSLSQFEAESHIIAEPAGSGYVKTSRQSSTPAWIEQQLHDRRVQRRVALRVPHFTAVPDIVQQTDLIAVISSGLFRYLPPMQLQFLNLPLSLARSEIKQYWHERTHKDPAHRWLRGLIHRLFAGKPSRRILG